MSKGKFKISTIRLGKDAEQIYQLIVGMECAVNEMQTSVDQMNTMWEGASKQAFVKAFADDRRAVSDVLKELKSLYQYEIQAKNNYESCENQVSDLVSNIRI